MIEQFTYIDRELEKGVDVVCVVENGIIKNKHIDILEPSDWGESYG